MAAIDLDTHTLAAALWTPTRLSPLARATVLAIAGSLFVALCAQITVPFWPVPLTGQTFAVLSVGLVCGWRIGGAALLLYLLEGAVGPALLRRRRGWLGRRGRGPRAALSGASCWPPLWSAGSRSAAGTAAFGGP